MSAPTLLWFRQDLRLADHAAMTAAVSVGAPIVPVYVLDDASAGAWPPGGASRWWLHHSLAALDKALSKRGSRLILRRGRTVDILRQLAAETGADACHFTRCYEPEAARLEHEVNDALSRSSTFVRRFSGALLAEPETLKNKSGEPFRVFTPFWRTLSATEQARTPLPAPDQLVAPAKWPKGDTLEDWKLLPGKPDWAGGLRATWQPGEEGAIHRLTALIDGPLARYAGERDRPDLQSTSMLSPHLHFGEISPLQCWQAVDTSRRRQPKSAQGAGSFLREVGWREFSYHLLHHWPSLPERPFRAEFEAFPWEPGKAAARRNFSAWSQGRTGYPIVDAGMRQLWQTGWMHNRVRMVAASFLTKHLLIAWQEGARWFWDTLVDADLANNSASWQWVAGSGADAAPYFRIFNPVLQGQKFDPDGAYVRKYVPELSRLDTRFIHAPWTAPEDALRRAGLTLGKSYPLPIVDHDAARQRALAAFATLKQRETV